ncbi:hypothetical protein HBN50_08640 [Halobacteriovorax sp. GB3]|uniref:hypothetical protein n=1 Tax=Halobacteriovorax sp. GB3 TaxID=2719615 RepID=UPI0023602839|nr:hypothetical protein [Halobacteriovorax sp. GB3]MDD0853162.1 hypothetical protein [Halobacteriovorax sp. GB3]
MLKKIKYIFLLLILGAIGVVTHRFISTQKQIEPYPYKFTYEQSPNQEINQSDVLVFGDQKALELKSLTDNIVKVTSKNLRYPLKVEFWAQRDEGLHRILHKLKSLKKLPKMIIVYLGSSEHTELKFRPNQYQKILKNIERYDNQKLLSLIMTLPDLSRFIYEPVKPILLSKEIIPFDKDISTKAKQIILEVSFKIFELELSELIYFARQNNSKLLFITDPINFELAPKEVCDNANSNTIVIEQNDIRRLLKESKVKDAYYRSRKLLSVTNGNAYSHYLVGHSAMRLGKYGEAKKELMLAHAYDCKFWRTHPVLNSIIRNKAKRESIPIIDFDHMVNIQLGRKALFLSDDTPQSIYYEQLEKELLFQIEQTFNL